ncbi:MAG: hypothetical protein JETCAE01_31580 [Anaerolineaceae bacterium]|nr:MAG: hypothetical protein JETCAE01_31580 [Anaerolineaceae bacterium]
MRILALKRSRAGEGDLMSLRNLIPAVVTRAAIIEDTHKIASEQGSNVRHRFGHPVVRRSLYRIYFTSSHNDMIALTE